MTEGAGQGASAESEGEMTGTKQEELAGLTRCWGHACGDPARMLRRCPARRGGGRFCRARRCRAASTMLGIRSHSPRPMNGHVLPKMPASPMAAPVWASCAYVHRSQSRCGPVRAAHGRHRGSPPSQCCSTWAWRWKVLPCSALPCCIHHARHSHTHCPGQMNGRAYLAQMPASPVAAPVWARRADAGQFERHMDIEEAPLVTAAVPGRGGGRFCRARRCRAASTKLVIRSQRRMDVSISEKARCTSVAA